VEVDVEHVGLAVGPVDDVLLPHLLAERLGLSCHTLPSHILRR